MVRKNCEALEDKMKRTFLSFLLVLTFLGCTDKEDGWNGRFTGTQRFGIGQVDSPITIVIERNGDKISGSVTPPFSNVPAPFQNGQIQGSTIRFDRKEGDITFRYEAILNPVDDSLQGGFQPLGCTNPQSGEPCQTDSNGSFNASKQ